MGSIGVDVIVGVSVNVSVEVGVDIEVGSWVRVGVNVGGSEFSLNSSAISMFSLVAVGSESPSCANAGSALAKRKILTNTAISPFDDRVCIRHGYQFG